MEEIVELRDFVKSVIVELMTGLSEANDAVRPSGAIVNPANMYPLKEEFGHLYGHISVGKLYRALHKIDLDVAVTAPEGGIRDCSRHSRSRQVSSQILRNRPRPKFSSPCRSRIRRRHSTEQVHAADRGNNPHPLVLCPVSIGNSR